ncbi:MAG: O-antigen ligase family protein [Bacteroidetes bacterium]|nr:O-antigen ligase family protein [Bacteroidota bacterium]
MNRILNRTGNPTDVLIFAIAFCIPMWPLGTSILTLLWLAISIITLKPSSFLEELKSKPFVLIFIGFFLMHVIGLIWTVNVSHGFKEIQDDLNLLIFPLLFAAHRPKPGSFPFIKNGFIAGTFVATLFCFLHGIYFFISTGDSGHMFYALFSAFLHPTYYGMILIVSCMFLLQDLFYPQTGEIKPRWFIISAFVLEIAAMSLLSSRIVYLVAFALFGYFVLAAFLTGNKAIFKNKMFIALTVLSAVFFYSSISLNNRFGQVSDAISNLGTEKKENMVSSDSLVYNSSTIRLAQFRYSMEILKDHWFLGVGTGDSRDELTKLYEHHNDVYALEHFRNPHSSYFHTWLMIGIPGLLLLLASILVPYFQSVKNRFYLYQGFLALIFITGFTDIISHATLGAFYAFMNSMLYCWGSYMIKTRNKAS